MWWSCPADLSASFPTVPLGLVTFKPMVLLFAQSFVHRIGYKYKWVNIVIAVWKAAVGWRCVKICLWLHWVNGPALCQFKPTLFTFFFLDFVWLRHYLEAGYCPLLNWGLCLPGFFKIWKQKWKQHDSLSRGKASPCAAGMQCYCH